MSLIKSLSEKLGPGMLFAAACVGTSHLVQSTRAGADYGFSLWWVILLACLIKYPVFYFGSAYAAATGESLIQSYFRQGRWAVAFFGLELFVNMFIATAAVALITGGLMNSLFQTQIPPWVMSGLLLALCALILILGKYKLFERVGSAFVVLFTLLILVAVVLSLDQVAPAVKAAEFALEWDLKLVLFMIAFAGWMPTSLGASAFQSLWVCAKAKALGRPITAEEARFDFNVGYIGTALLAFCFLLLGVIYMHQSGVVVAESAAGFAGQFMMLFTQAIGPMAYPVIAVAASAIMLSTLLTLMDACPRALAGISMSLQAQQSKEGWSELTRYRLLILLQCLGAVLMLLFFMRSFKSFIDFATSVSFLVAPLIAFINHRAMFSEQVPVELRPGPALRFWSWIGLVLLSLFAFCYLFFGLL